jgi:predicted DNA-binding WGR domain protein
VKGRVRYYLLKIEETLFGEYLLEKVYGSMAHKKPTRVLKEYYRSWVEAKKMFDLVVKRKRKKGYHI